ncbi:DUF2975 domain-containing protein [Hoeflea prorocentri]|uniref:DUF2975 domain-containing protein n=1 Tax=Hoeflea prorocentri TaxID=1922333 RepID=A0A9X3UFD5_9HYPH|nr:DUF2975 domain-containing protein [Hoeflea prorocentri]MCY6379599.1 DUF2975 domain-containing protein [Hoeflea prorocentri]MDA5397399.1 DUF2975 domain-containing protein [Hoeflea prorocentri]
MSVDTNPTDATFRRVVRLSLWLKRLATLGIILFVGFTFSVLAVPDWFDTMVMTAYPGMPIATGITLFKRISLILLLALPLGVSLYGLWNIRMLFDCYARGEVFSPAPAAHIRNVGLAMLVNVVLTALVHSLGSLVLTLDNPPGTRQLSVTASSDTYLLLLLGGLLLVIGWVMQEAARISDENSRFV